MMRFISHSRNTHYSSVIWHDSKVVRSVRYATRRVSLRQRIELTSKVRDLVLKHEFLKAGDAGDQLEATLGELLVGKAYLEWGLHEIQGLTIDGEPGTVETVIEKGPEELTNEIVATIRAQLELSEEERKNS